MLWCGVVQGISAPELEPQNFCPGISVPDIIKQQASGNNHKHKHCTPAAVTSSCCNPAGYENGLALPYRGQVTPSLPTEKELQALPSGPCRHVLLRSKMVRGNITTSGPTAHAGLGLQGYVQFTSPIRRYSDMLAHFQLKVNAHKACVPAVTMLLSLHGLGYKFLGLLQVLITQRACVHFAYVCFYCYAVLLPVHGLGADLILAHA